MSVYQRPTVFWSVVLIALALLNAYCLRININADTLFPYRYIQSLMEDSEVFLVVQPAARFFPEWLYAWIAYLISTDPLVWSRIVIAINTSILALSLVFFFTVLGYQRKQSLALTVTGLLVIPVLNLLHLNVLIYFVFSPGIHGSLISFQLISIALVYRWVLHGSISNFQAIAFVILNSALVASDIIYVMAYSLPMLAVLIYLYLFKKQPARLLLPVTALIILSIVLGYGFLKFLQGWEIFLLQQGGGFSGEPVLSWLQDNRLFEQILDRGIAGFVLEIIAVSYLCSCVVLIKRLKQRVNGLELMNVLHVFWLPILLAAMWYTGKENLRLIPYMILLSPLVLISNLVYWLKQKYSSDVVLWTLMALAGLSTYVYYDTKRPTVTHQSIYEYLNILVAQQKIGSFGLADYWLSHSHHPGMVKLWTITPKGRPYVFASNAVDYWHHQNKQKQPREFGFIVNRKNKGAKKWVLDKPALENIFGQWQQTLGYEYANKMYEIYLFDQPIITDLFYDSLEQSLQKMGKK